MGHLDASRPLAALLLWATATVASAHEGRLASQAADFPSAPWGFTLPTLDGSRFVEASSFTGPVLVNFWGRDCAPCIAELPRLQAFAIANPQWTVLLVSTDAPADAREFVERHRVVLPVLRSGANVTALMRSAGNRNGGLPFSVALRAGRVCDRQTGELDAVDVQRITTACSDGSKP